MRKRVVVRGGGDIATGTIYKLVKAGFDVLVLEIEKPSAIRRNVAFSEAVYEGKWQVEDMTCRLVNSLDEAYEVFDKQEPAIMIDPEGVCIKDFAPIAVVDAILAKKNLGTNRQMAPVTIALGPGFQAGVDVDAVVETMRGHHLGRVLYADTKEKGYLPECYHDNFAYPDTKTPGNIGGYTKERVMHSPAAGILYNVCHITDMVEAGQVIAVIKTQVHGNSEMGTGETVEIQTEGVPVYATISGLLRGLIRDGYPVSKGFKVADIDPRSSEYENCFTISDKARCIAGGVLEAIMHLDGVKMGNPGKLGC